MKSVYMLYKTDCWHTHASRELIGVCTTHFDIVKVIRERVAFEGEKPLPSNLWDQIFTIKQTQNYEGDGEFLYEEIELNKLL